TAAICASLGVRSIALDARCVGQARRAAADTLLQAGARWLASTDADSKVPPDWLAAQLQCGADAFCGTVRVADWLDFAERVRAAFLAGEHYEDDHPHVHGANFGLSAAAYQAVGGFPALAAHEDRGLLDALERGGTPSPARRTRPSPPRPAGCAGAAGVWGPAGYRDSRGAGGAGADGSVKPAQTSHLRRRRRACVEGMRA